MSYGVGVVFACLIMAVIIGMVVQAVLYARGRQVITRRQLALRMSAGSLLVITIGLMFYAAVYHFANPIVALIFWALMTLLPLVVIILAWLDLRQVVRTQHERQAELYRSLAGIERDLHEKRPGGD